jgi:hypothetical protein
MNTRRSVSMRSGSRLLMVTLWRAMSRAIAFIVEVSPARDPAERLMCGRGVVTIAEVMLMMRPNFLQIMPGSSACASNSGAIM